MKILMLVFAASLFLNMTAYGENSYTAMGNSYTVTGDGNTTMGSDPYVAACAKECSFLTKDCTAYLDCRVAKTTCTENCMQRKVWEKVAISLDKLIVSLEEQTQASLKEKEIFAQLIKTLSAGAQKSETGAE
ncbi:MAG: hypothetical protein PHQ96_00605 [Candidatus Omnitrophica bacterium]|nr:hypothetical protein [Candidatus Omnitrophota bacterium]